MLRTTISDLAGSASDFKNFRRKDFTPLFHPEAPTPTTPMERLTAVSPKTSSRPAWVHLPADMRAVLAALYGPAGQGA